MFKKTHRKTERDQREPEAERSEADGSHRKMERDQREPEAERSEAENLQ